MLRQKSRNFFPCPLIKTTNFLQTFVDFLKEKNKNKKLQLQISYEAYIAYQKDGLYGQSSCIFRADQIILTESQFSTAMTE